MNKKAKTYSVLVLAVVAVVAIVGLVLNFSGMTGAWSYGYYAQKCWDSDGKDVSPYTLDYVIHNNNAFYDKCEGRVVLEAACGPNSKVAWERFNCPPEMLCKEGKCAEPYSSISPNI